MDGVLKTTTYCWFLAVADYSSHVDLFHHLLRVLCYHIVPPLLFLFLLGAISPEQPPSIERSTEKKVFQQVGKSLERGK